MDAWEISMGPWNEVGVWPEKTSRMAKFRSLCIALLLLTPGFALGAQKDSTGSGSWSGPIINSTCSVAEAFGESPKCTEKDVPGARLSLFDDTTRQIFDLDPQDQAVGHLGDQVTVTGMLDGKTIHVVSLKMLNAIGLGVGKKAPAFSARDQFGQTQTLDTLRGPNGTVLLFFRSADW